MTPLALPLLTHFRFKAEPVLRSKKKQVGIKGAKSGLSSSLLSSFILCFSGEQGHHGRNGHSKAPRGRDQNGGAGYHKRAPYDSRNQRAAKP